jgi:putative SOS response-associated peptidase YedK
MCGRYTITITEDELITRYMIEEPTDRYHTPRYNAALTQKVPVILTIKGCFPKKSACYCFRKTIIEMIIGIIINDPIVA